MLKQSLGTLLVVLLSLALHGQDKPVRILKSQISISLGPYLRASSDGSPNWIGGRYSLQVGHQLRGGYMLGASLRWDRPWSETEQSEVFFPHRYGTRVFLRKYFQSDGKMSIFNEINVGSIVAEIRNLPSNPISVRESWIDAYVDARMGLQWRFNKFLSLEAVGGIRFSTDTRGGINTGSYQIYPVGRIGLNVHTQREWRWGRRKRKK
ncbi:MAG: hypothetical protein AAFV07_08285 [Bacteroidota bacterium]